MKRDIEGRGPSLAQKHETGLQELQDCLRFWQRSAENGKMPEKLPEELPEKIIVTEMKPENLEAVGELARQLGYPVEKADLENRFGQISRQSGHGQSTHGLFVALDPKGSSESDTNRRRSSGGVIGWIQINRESDSLLSRPRAEISALVVDSEYRGRGAGRALIEKAELWARENGLDLIRVRSNTVRLEAHRFYLRVGYKIEKSWHLFTKRL